MTKARGPVHAGILGYGYAARTFHAPLLQAAPGLRLTAVATSKPEALRGDWPEVAAVADPAALVARDDLELVVVATANDSHYPLARLALEAGKHVVVDKPFTVTLEEARALEALAQRQGRVLSVFHNRRWDADFLTLRRELGGARQASAGAAVEAAFEGAVASSAGGSVDGSIGRSVNGSIGRVVHFESHFDRFRPVVRDRWRERAGPGAGLWYDLGSHLVDQALQLFGAPEAIWLDTALQRDGAVVDDWFHAVLRYGSLRVVLHAGMVVAQLGPRFTVHGLRGSLIKHGLDPQEDALRAGQLPSSAAVWGVDARSFELVTSGADDRRELREVRCERGDYVAYYQAVAAAILGSGANPVPASEAIAVMALLQRGLQSARERRELAVSGEEMAAYRAG